MPAYARSMVSRAPARNSDHSSGAPPTSWTKFVAMARPSSEWNRVLPVSRSMTAKSTCSGGTARSSEFRRTPEAATGLPERPVFTASTVCTSARTTESMRSRKYGTSLMPAEGVDVDPRTNSRFDSPGKWSTMHGIRDFSSCASRTRQRTGWCPPAGGGIHNAPTFGCWKYSRNCSDSFGVLAKAPLLKQTSCRPPSSMSILLKSRRIPGMVR